MQSFKKNHHFCDSVLTFLLFFFYIPGALKNESSPCISDLWEILANTYQLVESTVYGSELSQLSLLTPHSEGLVVLQLLAAQGKARENWLEGKRGTRAPFPDLEGFVNITQGSLGDCPGDWFLFHFTVLGAPLCNCCCGEHSSRHISVGSLKDCLLSEFFQLMYSLGHSDSKLLVAFSPHYSPASNPMVLWRGGGGGVKVRGRLSLPPRC